MAKKRTKKQKIRAQQRQSAHRQTVSASAPTTAQVKQPVMAQSVTKPITIKEGMEFDTKLIQKDLFKSLAVTAFLLILLFGMYWYLR